MWNWKMGKKMTAEALGTYILVLFGCGSAVLMGKHIGMLGISLAFGISIVAAAYSLGAISGAHLNPAESLGILTAGRMTGNEFISYSMAQISGAIAAAFVLLMIANGKADYSIAENGLGQNGFGTGYPGEYSLSAALLFEFVMTFLFVTVILGATQTGAPATMAGLAIGFTLTGIHLVGINVTGVLVNPARSIGPAIFWVPKPLAICGCLLWLHSPAVHWRVLCSPLGSPHMPTPRHCAALSGLPISPDKATKHLPVVKLGISQSSRRWRHQRNETASVAKRCAKRSFRIAPTNPFAFRRFPNLPENNKPAAPRHPDRAPDSSGPPPHDCAQHRNPLRRRH